MAVFLATMLLFATVPMMAGAAPDVDFSVNDAEGLPGETVTLTVALNNNPGLWSLGAEIDYDSDQLELINAKDLGLFSVTGSFSTNYTVKPYKTYWSMLLIQSNDLVGDGDFVELTFRIKPNATVGTTIVSISDDNHNAVQLDSNNKGIAVDILAISSTITVLPPLTITTSPNLDIMPSTTGSVIDTVYVAKQVTGGKTPYTYSGTGLPSGITINSTTGEISGAPTTDASPSTATIEVTDAAGVKESIVIKVGQVTSGPFGFNYSNAFDIPASTVGTAISPVSVATGVYGGTAPYEFSATGLPAGLTIGAKTGVIAGIPTAERSVGTATVIAADKSSAQKSITINYGAVAPKPEITGVTIIALTVSSSTYSVQVGGTFQLDASVDGINITTTDKTVNWSVNGGVTGTAIDNTGLLTVSSAETATSLNVTATSVFDPAKSDTAIVTVIPVSMTPVITTASLSSGTVNRAYSQTLAATGDMPITWSLSSGSLPVGLSLDSATGAIAGTPTAIGTSNFTVTATNNIGSDSKDLSIVVVSSSISPGPSGGGGGGGGGNAVSPTSATVKQNTNGKYQDVTVTLNASGSAVLSSIKNNNATLVKDTDYTVDGKKITIKGSYLDSLSGKVTLTFDMNTGTDPKLTLTLSGETAAPVVETTTSESVTNSVIDDVYAVEQNVVIMKVGNKIYTVNGASKTSDVAPSVVQSRTFVPIRVVSEGLGAVANWDSSSKTVTISDGNTTVIMKVGSQTYTVNGEVKNVDAPAFVSDDRTFVPIRFVSEALKAKVDWENSTKTVTITG